MSVIKVVELIGESNQSWEEAVKEALREATKTIRHISGVEVLNLTGDVNQQGEMIKYKADVQIAFIVEPENE